MDVKKLNDLGLSAMTQWLEENHKRAWLIFRDGRALSLWCDDLETGDCVAEIKARDSVTGAPVTLALPDDCYEILHWDI